MEGLGAGRRWHMGLLEHQPLAGARAVGPGHGGEQSMAPAGLQLGQPRYARMKENPFPRQSLGPVKEIQTAGFQQEAQQGVFLQGVLEVGALGGTGIRVVLHELAAIRHHQKPRIIGHAQTAPLFEQKGSPLLELPEYRAIAGLGEPGRQRRLRGEGSPPARERRNNRKAHRQHQETPHLNPA